MVEFCLDVVQCGSGERYGEMVAGVGDEVRPWATPETRHAMAPAAAWAPFRAVDQPPLCVLSDLHIGEGHPRRCVNNIPLLPETKWR